jgi:hypothetical protein
MRKFIFLNKKKLSNLFKLLSITLLAITSLIFCFSFVKNQTPKFELLISILFFSGIIFPSFILLLGIISGIYKAQKLKKVFVIKPFDRLSDIGFSERLAYTKSKWTFTEETKSKNINGFEFICQLDKTDIVFKTFTFHKGIDVKEYKNLKMIFKDMGVNAFFFGIYSKNYNLKDKKNIDIEMINSELNEITELLLKYKFEPNFI